MPTILEGLSNELKFTLESTKPKYFKSSQNYLLMAFENASSKFKGISRVPAHIEYKLVQQFLNGDIDSTHPAFDLLGDMIHYPIEGNSINTIFFFAERLNYLLDIYTEKIQQGEDLQVTWKSLFRAYLIASNQDELPIFNAQLETLRIFLDSTWVEISQRSTQTLFDLKDVNKYIKLIQPNSLEFFSQSWLEGLHQRIIQMGNDLEIPSTSWFWEKLFVNILQMLVNFEDDAFKKSLPKLLSLLDICPLYQDLGIQLILERFSRCQSTLMNHQLMEYISLSWGSSIGTQQKNSPWNNIGEKSQQMIKAWHHERNLRIFFALKTGDKSIPQQKLDFWLNYLDCIEFSRLALGSVGQKIIQSQSSLQKIFHPKTNPYSKLLGDINPEQNALILKTHQCIIIDFIVNDGCYIYDLGSNSFDIQQDTHYSTTYKGGLKERYGKYGVTITQDQDWSDTASLKLLLNKYGL